MARVTNMKNRLIPSKLRRREGQALAEYALIITFVAIAAVAALVLLGGTIGAALSGVAGSF